MITILTLEVHEWIVIDCTVDNVDQIFDNNLNNIVATHENKVCRLWKNILDELDENFRMLSILKSHLN